MEHQQQNTFGKKKPLVRIWKNTINIFLGIFLVACQSENSVEEIKGITFQGETQGTTYQIILAEEKANFTNKEIQTLLAEFDMILSTYIDSSLISRINALEKNGEFTDPTGFFKECYQESIEVFKLSEGAFDASVFPLVEGWGFMKNLETPLSKSKVDSILQFVSSEPGKYHTVDFTKNSIRFTKLDSRFKLDFNAIAQGLAVDKLAEFIESKGHKNYYVEIGGELIVKGKNRSGENWNIGIDVPKEKTKDDGVRQLESVLSISNKAIATSGNYRKYYEKDGKKYAHCLDPRTGYPVDHSLLSATVVSNKCSTSDAYATVFMVLGLEKSKQFLEQHPELELDVYLLYDLGKGKIGRFKSEGMVKYFEK